MLDRSVERHLVDALASLEQPSQRPWIHDRPRQQVRPRLLPLLEHRNGDFAEPFADLGCAFEQLAEADRAGESRRTGADDQHADLDPLVVRIHRRREVVARVKRRREVGRLRHDPLRAFTSSVSFGTTSNKSPTTPKSASSKIGASGSLLTTMIVLEVCMPARCWIAPEMPTAT